MSQLHVATDGNQRVAALEAELAQARAEMQSFAATVSHDLRAPLRHITSFAQLLQEEAGPQLGGEALEFLGHITSSAQHLGQMLDALLALSRVGSVPVQLQPVALDALLQALVQEHLHEKAQDSGLQRGGERDPAVGAAFRHHSGPSAYTLRWSLAPGLPPVQADPVLLAASLGQVLDNAAKFSARRAAPTLEISTHLDTASGRVHCTVRDNGTGFAPEKAAQLFQPFTRLHSNSQFVGLGMGLALARKSLARLGGDVTISATPDVGCSVTVVLPAAQGCD